MHTRAAGRGCGANREKMKHIYNQLYVRGKGQEFETFIRKRFTYLIAGEGPAKKAKPNQVQGNPEFRPANARRFRQPTRVHVPTNAANMNKHGVFKSYRPHVLTFPKKMIFVNQDPRQLQAIVQNFIKSNGYVGTDYIIVEDRAYVEYFEAAHIEESKQVPKESREIYQYRQQHGPKTA